MKSLTHVLADKKERSTSIYKAAEDKMKALFGNDACVDKLPKDDYTKKVNILLNQERFFSCPEVSNSSHL